jgi:photosystem II stability/assembly factor-like uncharacterized protein
MRRLALLSSLAALALFAAVAADAADVTVGHSGWNWGNPQPQGNTLWTVEFAGGLGFAAGDFGTLLRTGDGGRSWTGVPTGTTASLTHVSIGSSSTVVVGDGCYLSRSDDGGITFKRLAVSCKPGIASLAFPSAVNGYVLQADGSVLRTADGGDTFTAGGSVPGTEATGPAGPPDTATDIFFTDASTGFAVTRGSSGGAVYRSTDGGHTWFQRTTSPQGLNGVYFPDAGVGYAVGSANTVLKTTDGGETWTPKPVPDSIPSSELSSIRCGSAATCVIATESGERVLRTTNGGNAYTAFSPAARKIFALAFPTPASLVAVGEGGTTVLSTNAGSASPSFVPVADQPLSGSFRRLRSGSASLVVASGASGKLARSSDGGHHWSTVQVPTSEDLRDVWFVDASTGFSLDNGGQVQRTNDGGDGWSELPTGTTARPNALYAPDASTVLLFGPKGVRRATSGTNPQFDLVESKPASDATLTDYDRTAGADLFAYGRKALIVSSDLGASWRKVKGPGPSARYRKVDFLTGKLGFALLENGRLFKTRNGGRKWTELIATGTARGYDLSFGDARDGFLSVDAFGRTGSSAWVLRTSDGGVTWRPQLIGPEPLDRGGIVAPDPSTAFGLAAGSELFYTGTGGDQSTTASTLTITPKLKSVRRSRSVKITGILVPAVAGAPVVVLARGARSHRWTVVGEPTTSATGTFTTSHRVSHTTQLVAQWSGNTDVNGAGSPVVTIRKR